MNHRQDMAKIGAGDLMLVAAINKGQVKYLIWVIAMIIRQRLA